MLSRNLTVTEALSDSVAVQATAGNEGALRRNHGEKKTLRMICLTKISQEKSTWPTKSALTVTVAKDKGTQALATA